MKQVYEPLWKEKWNLSSLKQRFLTWKKILYWEWNQCGVGIFCSQTYIRVLVVLWARWSFLTWNKHTGGCCFSKGHMTWAHQWIPSPCEIHIASRHVFTFSLENMGSEKTNRASCTKIKDAPSAVCVHVSAVGAWDFKVVLLLGSLCTAAEQVCHKAQSRFSDSDCRKFH